ncbi:MAG: lipoprotein [Betaproteobacteria bacterium]|nr:lipoprotein [Betaproteobacteria bacterium]MDE2123766.1 lipoprotein [Betaproteobacteria bacterium]MDE2185162.1 lipoprotein [Betaproteobacteria bacterium]MDE2324109.1 lipoprotein [Betaproteobacteria bacterium]
MLERTILGIRFARTARIVGLAVLLATCGLLSACGQRGPLVFPKPSPAAPSQG